MPNRAPSTWDGWSAGAPAVNAGSAGSARSGVPGFAGGAVGSACGAFGRTKMSVAAMVGFARACAPESSTSCERWWISGVCIGATAGSCTNISCKGGEVMQVDVGFARNQLDTKQRRVRERSRIFHIESKVVDETGGQRHLLERGREPCGLKLRVSTRSLAERRLKTYRIRLDSSARK